MPVPYGVFEVEFECQYQHDTGVETTIERTATFKRPREDDTDIPPDITKQAQKAVAEELKKRDINPSTATVDIDYAGMSRTEAYPTK